MAAPADRISVLSEIQWTKLVRLLVFLFVLALVTFVLAAALFHAKAQRDAMLAVEAGLSDWVVGWKLLL
ncbi:MAG: hypothetical protein WD906_05815 [Anaerolineales bacterium]